MNWSLSEKNKSPLLKARNSHSYRRIFVSSDSESESTSRNTSSETDDSYSSVSLDFHRSDSNSKSNEETDIKCLVEHIIPEATIKELQEACRSYQSLDGNRFCATEESTFIDRRGILLKSQPVRFPVTQSQTNSFFDQHLLHHKEKSCEEVSHSSYEYSSSSSESSVETLVFNPYVRASSGSKSSTTFEARSDLDSDGNSLTDSISSDDRISSSGDGDSEFDFLERECQSSESDSESVVLNELEEIFRKFGFLSNFEDLQYRDFRSIGRCSTIHEETESDGSCGSSKHNIIIKTSCGMGQYYATAVAPVDSNKPDEPADEDKSDPKMDSPPRDSSPSENGRIADGDLGHEYDIVSEDDLKNDDILDYKSEQFSKSPRSSPNSTINSSWRTSQASTNTVESSSTAVESDDTLGNDMSELSSINSRLSTLNDSTDPGFGSLDRKISKHSDPQTPNGKDLLETVRECDTSTVDNSQPSTEINVDHSLTPIIQKRNKSTIQDALEDLENIEIAAKNLLLKHESVDSDIRAESATPTNCSKFDSKTEQLLKLPSTEKPVVTDIAKEDKRTALDNVLISDAPIPSSEITRVVTPEIRNDDSVNGKQQSLISAKVTESHPIEVQVKSIEFSPVQVNESSDVSKCSASVETCEAKSLPDSPPQLEFSEDADAESKADSIESELITVEIVGMDKNTARPSPPPRKKQWRKNKNLPSDHHGDEKPPLPPSASPIPKVEVKKRWWSRTKETPIFISRESYNEQQVAKEMKKLRQSYRENDVNDFLDSLENTAMSGDVDEEFFEQLLADLKSDLNAPTNQSTESLNVITEAPLASSCAHISNENIAQDDPQPQSRSRSSSAARKFEKVKERIKELLRRKRKKKGADKLDDEKQITPCSTQTPSIADSRPETPSSRPVTPHSRSLSPEARSSRPITPEISKSDLNKKGFNLVGFLKKSSPKVIRKKYGEKKIRKSNTPLPSESETEDGDILKQSSDGISFEKSDNEESRSNLKGSKLSLDDAKSVKKEVRFSAGEAPSLKAFDLKTPDHCIIDTTPTIVDIKVKKQQVITVEETIDADAISETDTLPENNIDMVLKSAGAETMPVDNAPEIPLTIDDLNRAENLLPKLPERIKPPRRKKKQKGIPVSVENISSEDFRGSYGSDQSRDSCAGESTVTALSDDTSQVHEEFPNKQESTNAPVSIQAPNSFVPDRTKSPVLFNTSAVSVTREVFSSSKETATPDQHLTTTASNQQTSNVEATTSVPSSAITVSDGSHDTFDNVHQILEHTNTTDISEHIEVSINIDQSSVQDYSDVSETYSLKESSPVPFPTVTVNSTSFYDNDNPFEEPMTRIVEEEDLPEIKTENMVVTESVITSTSHTIDVKSKNNQNIPLSESTKKQDMLRSEEPFYEIKTEEIKYTSEEAEADHPVSFQMETKSPGSDEINVVVEQHPRALYQEAADVCQAMTQMVPQQEAGISPGHEVSKNESTKADLDALTSLAEKMTHLTSDMELEAEETIISSETADVPSLNSKHVHDSSTAEVISRIQVNHSLHFPESSLTDIFTTNAPTDQATSVVSSAEALMDVEENDGWVFLDKNDAAGVSGVPVTQTLSSKSFYRPSVSYTPQRIPPPGPNYTNTTAKTDWIQSVDNPVPVPPRQFQQKMPVSVVAELKSVLSESETSTILRKAPDPLPRWDSNIKFNELSKCKIVPPVPPAPVDSTNGRSSTTLKSLSTKPDLLCYASRSENNDDETNNVMRNVSVTQESLTCGVNDPVVIINPNTDDNCESNLETQFSSFPLSVHDKSLTECTELFNIHPARMQDKDTNVCLPLTCAIDKSSGSERTFKLRASVYGQFESSEGFNFEKQKPPVPRRRRGCSLYLEDGYMSDPGLDENVYGKRDATKRHSMFVESTFGVYSCSNRSSRSMLSNDKTFCKDATVNIPNRPPPPKSISMIPTVLNLSQVNAKRPPPVPSRKILPSVVGESDNDKIASHNENTNASELKLGIDYIKDSTISQSIDDSNPLLFSRLCSNSRIGGSTSSVINIGAQEADVKSSGATSVGGVSVDKTVAAGAAGPLPKLSENGSLLSATSCTEFAGQASIQHSLADTSDQYQVREKCSLEGLTGNQFLGGDLKTDSDNSAFVFDAKVGGDAAEPADFAKTGVNQRVSSSTSFPNEGVFDKKLKRASLLLDYLDNMEVLHSQVHENFVPKSHPDARERSPLPPPRPRTPIDERDPEQVRAEQRYETYFHGPPRAIHKPGEDEKLPEITLQQINAAKRYESYFHGPPRASTPTDPLPTKPDAEQMAALERYEGYFRKGPPRPRPVSEGDDRVVHPDIEQVEAEERYKSYFHTGPRRPPRPPPPEQEEKFNLPLEERQVAEKRYQSYFKKGPPRRKSQPDIDFNLEEDKREEAERRYMKYFEGSPRPRCSSMPDDDRTPSPDAEQIEAEKRLKQYSKGPPRAKHDKDAPAPVQEVTKEMLEAEERLNKYFMHPVPFGEPRKFVDPPLKPEEIHRRKLLAEYWSALQERNQRRTLKVVKVSKAKNEVDRESTPPSQRELVVEEFLQRVKDRKKERDLHYGDTDSEGEEESKYKPKKKKSKQDDEVSPDLKLEGGGNLAERVAKDLGDFIGEEGEFCLYHREQLRTFS